MHELFVLPDLSYNLTQSHRDNQLINHSENQVTPCTVLLRSQKYRDCGTGQSQPVYSICPPPTILEVVAASTQSGNLKTAIGGRYADLQ